MLAISPSQSDGGSPLRRSGARLAFIALSVRRPGPTGRVRPLAGPASGACVDTPYGYSCRMEATAHTAHGHHEMPTSGSALTRVAIEATLHCLTGCALGEIAGMVIGTALGFGNGGTV